MSEPTGSTLLESPPEHGVVTLTLNRPDKGNALSAEMIGGLSAALDRLSTDSAVRVVVLTGAGGAFCSGMDLSSQGQGSLKGDPRSFTAGFLGLCQQLRAFPKPVVAKVNGPAVGGGVVLLFLADVQVMESSAHVQFAEVRRGVVPAMISVFIVPQLGELRARDLFLTGRRVPAAECRQLGFVTEIADGVPRLDEATRRYCSYFLEAGPSAAAATKALIRYVASHTQTEAATEAAAVFTRVLAGDEMRQGLESFRQRKKAPWAVHADEIRAKL